VEGRGQRSRQAGIIKIQADITSLLQLYTSITVMQNRRVSYWCIELGWWRGPWGFPIPPTVIEGVLVVFLSHRAKFWDRAIKYATTGWIEIFSTQPLTTSTQSSCMQSMSLRMRRYTRYGTGSPFFYSNAWIYTSTHPIHLQGMVLT
jgi:hypothetical protein